jgi:hypothetical protein
MESNIWTGDAANCDWFHPANWADMRVPDVAGEFRPSAQDDGKPAEQGHGDMPSSGPQ